MPTTRETAHLALRELWVAADEALRAAEVDTIEVGGQTARTFETDGGALIRRFGDTLIVSAEFDTPTASEEIEVEFPADIRDLSAAEVSVNWSNDTGAGVNTPAMRKYPQIARQLGALI